MAEDPEWFNTPMLKYLSMKKDFLGKFLDITNWGEFGTDQQVIALSSLLDYFKRTRSLADQFPQLLNDVITDNKNLVIQRTLPLPPKLYEQVLLAVVEGAEDEYQSYWEQPSSVTLDKMTKFLVRKKISCVAAFECNVWSEVHRYEDYKSDKVCDETSEASEDSLADERWKEVSETRSELRKFRNKIYARMQCSQI